MDNKKNLICYFKKGIAAGSLTLTTIDAETKLKVDKFCFDILPETVLSFFKNVFNFIKNSAKAVIFNHVYDFKNPSFQTSKKFIQFILSAFKKLYIPIRLIDDGTLMLTHLLIAAKVNPKWDRNLIFIVVGSHNVFVEEVHREKEGYIRPPTKNTRTIKCPNGYDPVKVKDEILANLYPNKIFISTFSNFSKSILYDMLKVFGNDKYLKNNYENDIETIIEISSQLLDKKHNKYYVIPRFAFTVKNTAFQHIHTLSWNIKDGLPYQTSYIDERPIGQYYIERHYDEQKEAKIIQHYPIIRRDFHKVNLTLIVDENVKPHLIFELGVNQKIEHLPNFLTAKIKSKIPIIGFFGNSSVICFWNKGEKCYKFSDKWNGVFGEDLFISFDEKKPKYRNQASKVFKEKPTFVVYDLLKIMSYKKDHLFIHYNYQFTFTKDDENPVLIEFDNFDGIRKQATPEFLLALLLKDHLKITKEETGTKPDEIGFVIFDKNEYHDPRILPQSIKNSCDLLRVGCKILEI